VEGVDHGRVSEVVRDWRLRGKVVTLETEEPRRLVRKNIASGPRLAADAVFARRRARLVQPRPT
jgi:hypothetical protein